MPPLRNACDASTDSAGAVLEQFHLGTWQPLHFYSHQFSLTKSRYSAFDRELLLAYLSVRRFQPFIEGRCCQLITDHKPLIHAWLHRTDLWSPRQQRHLSAIAEFIMDIQHCSGELNIMPDALSRAPILAPVSLGINAADIATAQKDCPELRSLLNHPPNYSSLSFQKLTLREGEPPVLCEMSLMHPRSFLPRTLRHLAFTQLAHPGIHWSQILIGKRYFWPHMWQDIVCLARLCSSFQAAKTHQHTCSPISHIPVLQGSFTHMSTLSGHSLLSTVLLNCSTS